MARRRAEIPSLVPTADGGDGGGGGGGGGAAVAVAVAGRW